MSFLISLKVTKNQAFTVSVEDTFLEQPWGERGVNGQLFEGQEIKKINIKFARATPERNQSISQKLRMKMNSK